MTLSSPLSSIDISRMDSDSTLERVDAETTPVRSMKQRTLSHRASEPPLKLVSAARSVDGADFTRPDRAQRPPKKVRILPPISERFVRAHSPRPDSAKTYGNLASQKRPENRMSFWLG